MAKKIWRHTMSEQEETLWNAEEMQGWRNAFEGCVEDDAREEGCKKYMIYDSSESLVAKGEVRELVIAPVEP